MSLSYIRRAVCLPVIILSLFVWLSHAVADSTDDQAGTIAQHAAIVTQALESNLEIQAARASVEAVQARLIGASLPINNPELEMDAEHTDINTFAIGINQTLDWHDKQGIQEQVVQAELASAQAQLDALQLSKTTELLLALGGITTHTEITLLAKRRSEILERFTRLAEQRHRVGDIPLAEMQLARLSLAEAVMQHAGDGAELVQVKSDFFMLSGHSLKTPIQFPKQLPTSLPEITDEEALARQHPQVMAAHLSALAIRQMIQDEDRQRRADPTIGVRAGREDDDNLLGLNFTVPLQVRNDFRSRVDSARAEALKAEQEAQQVYRNIRARLQAARERYDLIVRAWSLWLSQGRSSLQQRIELLEAQWKAGEMNTTDYLLQVHQTLDTQIAGTRLHGDLWNAWIEWINISGVLDTWLNSTLEAVNGSSAIEMSNKS